MLAIITNTEVITSTFVSALLPPLSIALAGYLFGTYRNVDADGVSAIAVYILMPALVFETLVTLPVDVGTATAIVVAMVAFTAIMSLVAWTVGQIRNQGGTLVYGAAMAAAFPNTGNFGIPVATFAFGETGRSTAVLFVLVQNLLLYTFGIFFLSKGRAGSSYRDAVERVARQPVTYAVACAAAAVFLDVVPPEDGTAMETIGMVGDASIPIFLLILGVQIAKMDVRTSIRQTIPTVGLKLFVAPVVAILVVVAADLGTSGATQAFVVLAAGPSAVAPLVLSIEFGDDDDETLSTGDYVGTAIFLTLLGSVPIVTGLLVLTEQGFVG